tara:strand:- start:425 stop:742 length:318 start_codon:yes stop_codon:yes gene_type:complete
MAHELTGQLVSALTDVPWNAAALAVDNQIRELRTLANVSTGLTALTALLLRKKPRSSGGMSRAIQQWDHADAKKRRAIILDAWRRANPRWAFHIDHDPYPKGPRA